jgi:hypothetical protein
MVLVARRPLHSPAMTALVAAHVNDHESLACRDAPGVRMPRRTRRTLKPWHALKLGRGERSVRVTHVTLLGQGKYKPG